MAMGLRLLFLIWPKKKKGKDINFLCRNLLGCNQLIHESFHNLSNLVFSSDVGDEAILKELLERYTSSVDEVCVIVMVNLIYLCFLEVAR